MIGSLSFRSTSAIDLSLPSRSMQTARISELFVGYRTQFAKSPERETNRSAWHHLLALGPRPCSLLNVRLIITP